MADVTMIPAGGVDLCVQTFGGPPDPPVLLIAGAADPMDRWDEEFGRRLAAGSRRVIRYDHRDTGRSTSFPAGAPPYDWTDLAHDALALLDALDEPAAHLVAFGLGGLLAAQVAASTPERVRSLTLICPATSAAWPDADWGDRRVAVDRIVAELRERAGPFQPDEPRLRRLAQTIFDRSIDMMATRTNHRLVFADARPPAVPLAAPALILRGSFDTGGSDEGALPPAQASPLADAGRVVVVDGMGYEYPPRAVWPQVTAEILRHTSALRAAGDAS